VLDERLCVLRHECVYYAQLQSRSGALRHTGDEKTGEADLGGGDDEIIIVDFARMPANVCALHFIVTVATEGKTFADVKSARVRALAPRQQHALPRTIAHGRRGAATAV
jgi:tellurium resistance protein TerZ